MWLDRAGTAHAEAVPDPLFRISGQLRQLIETSSPEEVRSAASALYEYLPELSDEIDAGVKYGPEEAQYEGLSLPDSVPVGQIVIPGDLSASALFAVASAELRWKTEVLFTVIGALERSISTSARWGRRLRHIFGRGVRDITQ